MSRALTILRAAADPTRLRILALVEAMELSVGELAQILCQSQPRVSRHVKILADAGLIARQREGSWMFLRGGDPEMLHPLLDMVARADGVQAEHQADLARLASVRAERVAASERYFAQHAESWDALRSLHVADAEVEQAICTTLGTGKMDMLVDIGTGTGRMLTLLGHQAGQAIGIDRSSEMLRVARGKCEAAGLANVQLRQGDMFALPLDTGAADVVILHQVLHYADAPGDAIAEAARILRKGGRLLIVDFAPHHREELRSQHAHSRLGFEDRQMLGWITAAGLDAKTISHLQGGELTVTLWLGTKTAAQDKRA